MNMHSLARAAGATLLAVAALPSPAQDATRIVAATVYPDSARVERELKVPGGTRHIVLACVPSAVDVTTLQVDGDPELRVGEIRSMPLPQTRWPECDPSPLEVIPAEDEIDKALWLMTLSDALDDLTPAHREVLVETYFKGRTVNEAAETLGIPSGTVRSRVFYALRSMKLALEERGVTA